MAYPYDEGLDNSAYHYSETLEIDRGQHGKIAPQRNSSFRPNPYDTYEDYNEGRPEVMDYSETIPLSTINPRTENVQNPLGAPLRDTNPYGSGYYNPAFENEPDYAYRPPSISSDQDDDSVPYSARHVEMALKENKNPLRRRTRFQSTLPAALMDDPDMDRSDSMLQETAKYIKKLADMSTSERTKEIQKLPIVLKTKKELRNNVVRAKRMKSRKGARKINCCTDCWHTTALSFKQTKEMISDAYQALRLWQKTLKSIGAKFGTSILSYFTFLKWLLFFNIFSFVVNFSFITIPQLLYKAPNNSSFSGLELLTGEGYFLETVLYYGSYTNSTIQITEKLASYNMQLAYIFTIGFYLLICFLSLVYSMARSFRKNFINPNAYSVQATKLLCAWDFSLTNEKAIKQKQKNLSTQIKEALSDLLMEQLSLTIGQRIARFLIHVLAWVLSMGTAVGCCAAVFYVSKSQPFQISGKSDLEIQAATLVLPVVVAFINLIMPFIYSLFGFVEKFKYPKHEIYVLIIRNVFLKISIVGVLCYYWLQIVAESSVQCWERLVGAEIYRLIVFDFIFCLLGSFFGEFLRRIIGITCCKSLGMPEFDIARNVLDLIYAQTLAWIGIYFSPLLPVIQIIKLFIIFYVKKVSLMMNCVPHRRAWRASQMTTVFIFLLFFPSFTGVLSVIGVTVWSRNSSTTCGPFRSLDHPYSAISSWVATISMTENLLWVVWIYNNIIESAFFFFIITLIVLIISYLYWQIIQGRKIMIKLLHEQIANEGKKKMFLLDKLNQLQKKNGRGPTNHSTANGRTFTEPQSSYRLQEPNQFPHDSEMHHPTIGENDSQLWATATRAKQQDDSAGYQSSSTSGGNSEALAIAMRAKQEADSGGGSSEAMAIAMEARQQAESEGHQLSVMKEFGSEVLQTAMKARQQAESEGHHPNVKAGGSDAVSARQPPHSDGYQPRGGSNALAIAMRAKEEAVSQEH